MRARAWIGGAWILGLLTAVASADILTHTDWDAWKADADSKWPAQAAAYQELNWEAFSMGDPAVDGTEHAAGGLIHNNGLVSVVDDVGNQTDPTDRTNASLPGTGGRRFSRGLGCRLPETNCDSVILGLTGVPAVAMGVWIIDSEITSGESIVANLLGPGGAYSLSYPMPAMAKAFGGTRTNVLFFGLLIDPPQGDRITALDIRECVDGDNVSYGAVAFIPDVPEPGTLALLLTGGVALRTRRRRRPASAPG